MADALAPSLNPVFHGNPSLANRGLKPASLKESWWRDAKAIGGIAIRGFKTEAIAAAASALPPNDPLGMFLTKLMVNTLWSSMLHPPLSYKGENFQYRSADGSSNSILFPQLGKGKTPYAKTVQAAAATHGAKPDPGDLFDMLMARDENKFAKESDLGLSSMLLYHADTIIHDIFRTNSTDKNISDTSSYLDLSPLYGRDRQAQESIREMEWGLLKPDTFAEDRLLNQPPGVSLYLIMYNRFHNYVARQLIEINENGRFEKKIPAKPKDWNPDSALLRRVIAENELMEKIAANNAAADKFNATDDVQTKKKARMLKRKLRETIDINKDESKWPKTWDDDTATKLWKKQFNWKLDEDLFQTARLVTCGLYINISIHDYLRCLMRKHAELTSWTLDPRLEMSIFNKDTIQRGIGNQVTVEFNVLYRFHSPLSKRDAAWTKRFLQSRMIKEGLYPATDPKDPAKVSVDQFREGDIPLWALRQVLAGLYQETDNDQARNAAPASPRFLRVDDDDDRNANGDPKSIMLQRDEETYKFDDFYLATEMVRVLQDPICQFGAQNVPKFMRTIEILGILQSRKWEMSTLNEFRAFFKMPRHEKFEDINSDPGIQTNLRNLYGHPDMVELYPGLFCEGQGRCLDPGTSCPNGSTALWRGVFSDAVTLVRSDRFYTIDWNTDSLTAWGMNEVIPDIGIFKGGVMGRLFQRAFPGYFKDNAIHLWEPFYTPAMNTIVAYQQNQLYDLQPVDDVGVSKAQFNAIMNLNLNPLLSGKASEPAVFAADGTIIKPRVVGSIEDSLKKLKYNLAADDIDDIEHTRQALNQAFNQLSWLKRLFNARVADKHAILNKIRFKILRDRVKMKVVQRSNPPLPVSNLETLRDHFLKDTGVFKNPGYADKSSVPDGPLRKVLTQEGPLYHDGMKIFQSLVTPALEKKFFEYFEKMSQTIRQREELDYTTYYLGDLLKVKQIDVIRDFSIPVVTRFAADFLGFGHLIKTAKMTSRPYDENQIFDHFKHCQDYLTFDSDETKAYRHRKAFQSSIQFLLELTEKGVADARKGFFESRRNYHSVADDDDTVTEIRKFGVQSAQKLTKALKGEKEAAAVMLAVTLDAVHKSIVMFAEVLRCLLHDNNHMHWKQIVGLAKSGSDEAHQTIARYVLEAQRIKLDVPLVRQYVGAGDPVHASSGGLLQLQLNSPASVKNEMNGSTAKAGMHQFTVGETFLLDIHKAVNDETYFPNPDQIILDRPPSAHYLIYHPTMDGKFNSKRLTILAISAMIKHLGRLTELREAHDAMGKLKTALVPAQGRGAEDEHRSRFLNVKWDELSSCPSSWSLRYDGVSAGVAKVTKFRDNSNQGHGMEQLQ